jgi:hypothetical protein
VTIHNQIADKLKNAFFQYYRYNPSQGEVHSWQNSLRALSQIFQHAKLNDHGVILEYQLPLTSKRLDCLVMGKDENEKDNAVIIELKQWEKCENTEGENEVLTWVAGAKREVLHPSIQVGRYQMYLQDTHTAFNSNESISLGACSYLHNYISHPNDEIFSEKFSKALDQQPIFIADDVDKFRAYLCSKLSKGAGMEILEKVEQSKYKPSKLLMDHVCQIIREKSEYILLDEQLIVYDKVLTLTKKGLDHQKKSVIIVKGGPGTGKSVIAINLMADLLRNGYNTHYATGSKAFTETLRKKIGVRGSAQFKYFNSYATANPNEIDVLIADEAHRIRETSNSRFTKKILRSDMPQIEELIRISKLGVFLLMISKMFAQMRLDHQNI